MLEKASMKRNLKFTFRANMDTIVAYEFYELVKINKIVLDIKIT